MAEYTSGTGDGAKKQFEEDKLSVKHFKKEDNTYKVLSANPSPDKKTLFVSIREGVTGGNNTRIVLACSKTEVAYIIMELTRIYNQDMK